MAKRLVNGQQIKDSVKTTGFGVKSYYQPKQGNLSISQIREYVLTCYWINICVNTIVDEVIKYPLSCEPANTKIDSFLRFPSEIEPLMITRKKYLKDMLRFGNGACLIGYEGDTPKFLRAIPGYTIRLTSDDIPNYQIMDVNSGALKTDANKNPIVLNNREVMLFQLDVDSDATLAKSPIDTIPTMLDIDKSVQTKLAEFTDRGLIKPAFVSIEKATKRDVQDFVEYMNALVADGGKLFGINKNSTLTELKSWSVEETIAMMKWLGLVAASVYKVPPFMLNLVQDTGSLNAREQKARFLENAVLPILEYEAHVYTLGLAIKGFKSPKTHITSPMIGTRLNYDRARVAQMLTGGVAIVTVDEARKMFFGLDPMTGKEITE